MQQSHASELIHDSKCHDSLGTLSGLCPSFAARSRWCGGGWRVAGGCVARAPLSLGSTAERDNQKRTANPFQYHGSTKLILFFQNALHTRQALGRRYGRRCGLILGRWSTMSSKGVLRQRYGGGGGVGLGFAFFQLRLDVAKENSSETSKLRTVHPPNGDSEVRSVRHYINTRRQIYLGARHLLKFMSLSVFPVLT